MCGGEGPVAIVHGEEFGKLFAKASKKRKRFVAWQDDPGQGDAPTLDEIALGRPAGSLDPPQEPSMTTLAKLASRLTPAQRQTQPRPGP